MGRVRPLRAGAAVLPALLPLLIQPFFPHVPLSVRTCVIVGNYVSQCLRSAVSNLVDFAVRFFFRGCAGFMAKSLQVSF